MQNEVASDKTNFTYLEGTPAVNGDVLEVTDNCVKLQTNTRKRKH